MTVITYNRKFAVLHLVLLKYFITPQQQSCAKPLN